MMNAGKQPAANENVEMRRGIAPGDVDAFPMLAVLFPFHGDAVSRVLRRETEGGGQRSRADLLQANETDARDSHAMHEFSSKWPRQTPLDIAGPTPLTSPPPP